MTSVVRRCTAADDITVFEEGRRTTTHDGGKCTCRSYRTNGSCDHLNKLRDRVCAWRETDSLIPLGADPTVCPVCGSPTGVSRA